MQNHNLKKQEELIKQTDMQKNETSTQNANTYDFSSSEQEEIDQLESEIAKEIEEMKVFKQQMKRRRVAQDIEQKQEQNPFIVKQTYVDRQLKKINAKSGDLKVTNSDEDEQEMQKKVQQILKKINL